MTRRGGSAGIQSRGLKPTCLTPKPELFLNLSAALCPPSGGGLVGLAGAAPAHSLAPQAQVATLQLTCLLTFDILVKNNFKLSQYIF